MGRALVIGGLALALICHLAGSWELFRYKGKWSYISSPDLEYDIPCYDARPVGNEVGRVVIYCGFAASAQLYFPLALSLLRSGYAVRLVATSGSPNSGVPMSYKSHGTEALAAAHDFLDTRPNIRGFSVGHSEGTRYAIEMGRDVPLVKGVVAISTISSAIDTERPENVLLLVAERDFAAIKRQTTVAFMNGTGLRSPQFGTVYGEIDEGTARAADIIPGTNHVNIFLKENTQRRILNWINRISGSPERRDVVEGPLRLTALVMGAILCTILSVVGIGLMYPAILASEADGRRLPVWAFLVVLVAGWGTAAVIANSLTFIRTIPLLVYGRILIFFVIAAVALLLVAIGKRNLGAGLPRGTWRARIILLTSTATMLLFDLWFVSVIPSGQRLLWFFLSFLITGGYFACDEFLRRGIQRGTDWQTGLAIGLAGAFVAAISIATAAFFVGSPVGGFLVGGAMTLFLLMSVCEPFATYLFATTGDWLLSWWIRVSVFNGFVAGIVPLVTEAEFRSMLP